MPDDLANAICSLIDHCQPFDAIREEIAKPGNQRKVFWLEAHCDDWPEMLARHLLLDPWPEDLNCLTRCVFMRKPDSEVESILDGWCEHLSFTAKASRADRQQALHQWLNQASLTVFYTEVRSEHWRRMPAYLHGAHQALAHLGNLDDDKCVIVLFACTSSCRPPLWTSLLWKYHVRRRVRKLAVARALPGLGKLKKEDIADWHMGFPRALRNTHDSARLKSEIFDQVFRQKDDPVRFDEVRRHLVECHGLVRARKC